LTVKNHIANSGHKGVRSNKGARTRERLLVAAVDVFDRDGYVNARVTDVAERAKISHGAFYRYFSNKESILEAILGELEAEFWEESRVRLHPANPKEAILQATAGYFQAFQRNAVKWRVLVEAAATNRRFLEQWMRTRGRFIERIRARIERDIEAGTARPVDAGLAASALAAMTEYFAYLWLSLDGDAVRADFSLDRGMETVADLWYQALYCKGNLAGD